MDLGLAGRTAVVTGAGRGIGLAVTRALAAEGALVTAGSRTVTPELKELQDGGRVRAVAVDLAAPDGPAELVAAAGPTVDVLVNNVGAARTRTSGILADPAVVDYAAAKAALADFAKSLAKEVGPHGVRVNTVSPGPVATDLWLGTGGVAETVSQATGLTPQEIAAGAVAGSATGRFTRPEEVADAVLFLAGDRAANMTGADLRIDGGLVPTWS